MTIKSISNCNKNSNYISRVKISRIYLEQLRDRNENFKPSFTMSTSNSWIERWRELQRVEDKQYRRNKRIKKR